MKFIFAIILASTVISIACSASRSAGSPAQVTDNPTINQSLSPIVSSSPQEKAACSLDMSQLPAIKGLKLRMTTEEVLAVFPGSEADPKLKVELSAPPNRFGTLSFVIQPSEYQSKEQFADVSNITFALLDARVSNFHIGYNGPRYSHVDEFVAKFVSGTSLPTADQWEPYVGLDTQLKILKCADFEVRVFAARPGVNVSYVSFKDLDADKKLKDRRKKARKQASPTPGNQ